MFFRAAINKDVHFPKNHYLAGKMKGWLSRGLDKGEEGEMCPNLTNYLLTHKSNILLLNTLRQCGKQTFSTSALTTK